MRILLESFVENLKSLYSFMTTKYIFRTKWKEAAKGVILSSSAGENSKNIATRSGHYCILLAF